MDSQSHTKHHQIFHQGQENGQLKFADCQVVEFGRHIVFNLRPKQKHYIDAQNYIHPKPNVLRVLPKHFLT